MAECACCGGPNVTEGQEVETFPCLIGRGPETQQITVMVPVIVCADCGLQYTDSRAEDIREAAAVNCRKEAV